MDDRTGTIQQIVGVVIDVRFDGQPPAIYNALTVNLADRELVLEVVQHLSTHTVKAVAMGATEGLRRGQTVTDTGHCISVPVGKRTLGRMFNVIGQPIDGQGGQFKEYSPIHRPPPSLAPPKTLSQIL